VDPHKIRLDFIDGRGQRDISAAFIVVAVGTKATRVDNIPFDSRRIFVSDEILELDRIPRTLTVIGGGVIGCEYASIFAALGVRVSLIDKRKDLLGFVDAEIADALVYHLRQQRVRVILGEEVADIRIVEDGEDGHVEIKLASGKKIMTEKALYSIGRTGATDSLNISSAGLTSDDRGRLTVNENYQTEVAHIYAVGDIIGFPSLASTSMEQGRLAAAHAFNLPTHSVPELFPYGVYTVPEISMCGRTEAELTTEDIPYEVGKAQYKEISRGQIIGDSTGMLKMMFHLETRKILGVHIIGEGASELIHIGQAVMAFEGTVDYFVDTVFNYPTLAECYKTAAFDGLNRLNH
jgi:NAD(P) transhydrogenase